MNVTVVVSPIQYAVLIGFLAFIAMMLVGIYRVLKNRFGDKPWA